MSENPVNSRTGDEMSPGGPVVNWDRIVHKNIRTADDQGMGKVIAVPDNEDTIVISSQSADDIYKVPRSTVSGFNGAEVQLGITSGSMASYHVESAGAYEAQPSNLVTGGSKEVPSPSAKEMTVPVVEERLRVSKKKRTEEATITKRPVRERKSRKVPVTRERLVVKRRRAGSGAKDKPVESAKEIKVPLRNERIEVSKEPYVKEEVVVRKKPVTETRIITDTVASERVDVEGKTRAAED